MSARFTSRMMTSSNELVTAPVGSFFKLARRVGSANFDFRSSTVPMVASRQAGSSSHKFQSWKVKVKPALVETNWP